MTFGLVVQRPKGRTYINIQHAVAFGQKVKALRLGKNLTQRELAFEAGVDERTIRRIEKAEMIITLDLFFSVARALKIHPRELLDYTIENGL